MERKNKKYAKRKTSSILLGESLISRKDELREKAQEHREKKEFKEARKIMELIEAAYALRKCGDFLIFRNFYTVGKTKMQGGFFCHIPMLCGICAIIRSGRLIRAYKEKLEKVLKERKDLKLLFITITVKNGDDLQERFEHLKAVMNVMKNRRKMRKYKKEGKKTIFTEIEGAVYSYEVTNIGNGFHPHNHMDALVSDKVDVGKFKKELRKELKEISGDSDQLDVQEVVGEEEMLNALIETFKYALKMNDMKMDDQIECYEKLRKKRMVESFGLLRGVKLDSKLDDDVENEKLLPYIDMVYKYCDKGGYKFVKYIDKKEIEERWKYIEETRRDIESRGLYLIKK